MTIETTIAARLGTAVQSLRPLGAGTLSEVFDLRLADGRRLVVKRSVTADAEGGMLRAIRATGCAAPEVVHSEDGLLVMERLKDGGHPAPCAWEAAGAAIARLHAARGGAYGWPADHAFGHVSIPNAPAADWPTFWGERRLLAEASRLPADIARRLDRLTRDLASRLPAAPPPALLHGDLWSGNVLFGLDGFSGLIDPAAYHGDAEVDIAMLTLFGAPPPAFFEGYGALPEGWESRRAIYQIWPALVHLRLFGQGYRAMVERLLTESGI